MTGVTGDPLWRAPRPGAATPGWTPAEYRDAGAGGKEAARRFRNLWLPPPVAAALRAAGFTVDDIEIVARDVPASLLHQMASAGFLAGANAWETMQVMSSPGRRQVEEWMQVRGATLPVVQALTSTQVVSVPIRAERAGAWAATYRSDVTALYARVRAETSIAATLRQNPNGWLAAAVTDAKSRHPHPHALLRDPVPPPLAEADPGLGGLTGLAIAAGLSPASLREVLADTTRTWADRVRGMYTMALLNCDDVVLPDLTWWESR